MRLALLIALLFFAFVPTVYAATGLTLEIVRGEGAIHNVRERQFVEPVIRVTDNGLPAPDAIVTFVLPQVGPSGTFTEGTTLTLTTGPDGIATGRGFRPNSLAGQFELRIAVSYLGRTARVSLLQTNAAPVQAQVRKSRSRAYVILGAVIGGAAAGAAATLGGGSSSPAATAMVPSLPPLGNVRPPAVISAGSGSIGVPVN